MLRSLGGFANRLATTFQVACCVLRTGDATELVNNTPYLLLITFLIYCVTRLSELATQDTVLWAKLLSCSELGELSSAVGKNEISKPMTWPFFLDRSHRSKFVASDNVSQKACIGFCALKQDGVCEQAILHMFGCQHLRVELRHGSCLAQILAHNCMAQTRFFGHFSDR